MSVYSRRGGILKGSLPFFFLCLASIFFLATPSTAQVFKSFQKILGQKPDTTPVETAAADTPVQIDQQIEELEARLEVTREQLSNARQVKQAEAVRQFAATPEEADQRTRYLIQITQSHGRHIDVLRELQRLHAAKNDLEARIASWQGFTEPPPYSIDFADSLRDQVQAEELEIESLGIELVITRRTLEKTQSRLEPAQTGLRQLAEKMETVEGKATERRTRWLFDLANYRVSHLRAAAELGKAQRRKIELAIDLHSESLDFLRRKLTIAEANAPFTEEQLQEKLESLSAERQKIQKELEQATAADSQARQALEEARTELKELREAAAEKIGNATAVNQQQNLVDMLRAKADTTSVRVESLKLILSFLDAGELLWERRFDTAHTRDPEQLATAYDNIAQGLIEVEQLRPYFDSNLELTRTLITNHQQLLDSPGLGGTESRQARQTLEAYLKRDRILRRGLVKLDQLEKLLQRWRDVVIERRQKVPWSERVAAFISSAGDVISKVWSHELFTISEKGITVSKLVLALLILTIGTIVSRKIAKRMKHFVRLRFHVEEGVAAPIEKAFFYFLFLLVLLFSLNVVKIPLTIFAFFGGAVAIGVGFGAQNLINNFISGLIMLFERPIKVGDIVEVDGIRGKVINIGARCSQVRRYDGIDMLVPNSSFLEKNVTNLTLSDLTLRFTVTVGVAYGSPTREVERLIYKAVEEHGKILAEPKPVVIFEEFGDNSLVFTVYFWLECTTYMDFRIVASDIRYRIDKLFREAGITIAFPQRDVHFDSEKPIRVQIAEGETPEENSDSPKGKLPG